MVEPVTSGGFRKVRAADGQVLCYHLEDTTRVTVDSLAADLKQEMRAWPHRDSYRLMVDFCNEGAIITSYMLHRIRELARCQPELTGKVAILAPHRATAEIAGMILRGLPGTNRIRKLFSCESTAMAWLLQED